MLSYTLAWLNGRIVDACNITTSVRCTLEVHRVPFRSQISTSARQSSCMSRLTRDAFAARFLVNSIIALSHRPRLVLLAYRSTPHPRARAFLAFLLG